MLVKMAVSHFTWDGVPALVLYFSFLLMQKWWAVVIAEVIGLLLPMWETLMALLAPSF